jgi:hypothetical protein
MTRRKCGGSRLLVALFFVVLLAGALGTFGAWELGPGTSHESVREWVLGLI